MGRAHSRASDQRQAVTIAPITICRRR